MQTLEEKDGKYTGRHQRIEYYRILIIEKEIST